MTDGVFLQIPKNLSISIPIHLIFINTQTEPAMICPRNVIVVEEGAQVILIEEYRSESGNHFTNALTEIYAGHNAKIKYHKIQDESYQQHILLIPLFINIKIAA